MRWQGWTRRGFLGALGLGAAQEALRPIGLARPSRQSGDEGDPVILLPDALYAVVGQEFNLYWDGIIRSQMPLEGYDYNITLALPGKGYGATAERRMRSGMITTPDRRSAAMPATGYCGSRPCWRPGAGRKRAGVYLVPLNANLDTRHNMLTEHVTANARNTVQIVRQSGAVHPGLAGNWQMADTLYAFLRGQEAE